MSLFFSPLSPLECPGARSLCTYSPSWPKSTKWALEGMSAMSHPLTTHWIRPPSSSQKAELTQSCLLKQKKGLSFIEAMSLPCSKVEKATSLYWGASAPCCCFEGLSVPLLCTSPPKSFPAPSQAFAAGLKLVYTTAYDNPIFKNYFFRIICALSVQWLQDNRSLMYYSSCYGMILEVQGRTTQ